MPLVVCQIHGNQKHMLPVLLGQAFDCPGATRNCLFVLLLCGRTVVTGLRGTVDLFWAHWVVQVFCGVCVGFQGGREGLCGCVWPERAALRGQRMPRAVHEPLSLCVCRWGLNCSIGMLFVGGWGWDLSLFLLALFSCGKRFLDAVHSTSTLHVWACRT